ncbi:ESF1 homolog isoform X2 [Watersipora subatra]|uniref:ESF1 homolog isoform X2 n=1 Tax=Watersipora subatra TaxID=2589382 RepID=UPI00355C6D1C
MMTSPIYPSEFGEEKIREYKLSGPKELPSAEGDEAGEEERKITNLLEHDRMEFYEDELKNSAYHVPDNCEPNFFVNPAVGQLLVRCTWDENGPDRSGVFIKKYQAYDLEQLDNG